MYVCFKGMDDQGLQDPKAVLSPDVQYGLESQTFKLVPLRRSRSQLSGSVSNASMSSVGSASDLMTSLEYAAVSSSSAFSSPTSNTKPLSTSSPLGTDFPPPMPSTNEWIQPKTPSSSNGPKRGIWNKISSHTNQENSPTTKVKLITVVSSYTV